MTGKGTRNLDWQLDRWTLREPFVTARESIDVIETVTATVSSLGVSGRGEALGVDYLGETPASIGRALEAARAMVEAGASRDELAASITCAGARNALDSALWDLEAKLAGRSVWEMTQTSRESVPCLVTLPLGSAGAMARAADNARQFGVLKLKLDRRDVIGKVRAVHDSRPDAELVIDANESWDVDTLLDVTAPLAQLGVVMIEQPLPRNADNALATLDLPVAIGADESCQGVADLRALEDRYDTINIKLDKCGGLTEALAMLDHCRQNDLEVMVGNMLGSSLAMAPAFAIAAAARFVDLDGPLLQREDRQWPIRYENGRMYRPPPELWGGSGILPR